MIRYLPGDRPNPAESREVEFIGGPRAGERGPLDELPDALPAPGGIYRRSVACADDGLRRYVWSAARVPTMHRTAEQ